MKTASAITAILLVVAMATATDLVLDDNSFTISNYVYRQARIAQWGKNGHDWGTFERGLYKDQLWRLRPSGHNDGCYYMENVVHKGYRLAAHGDNTFVYSGNYYADQLWRFEEHSTRKNFFYIHNCHHKNHRLAKWGHGDGDVGTYSGPRYDDQLWELSPQYSAKIITAEVKSFDNRQGMFDIPIEVKVTKGFKKTSTTSTKMTTSSKLAMEASLSGVVKAVNIGVTISAELTNTLEKYTSSTTEESWTETETVQFKVPAHRNWKIVQHQVFFDSEFPGESGLLYSKFKIFTSETDKFEDDDSFIINS